MIINYEHIVQADFLHISDKGGLLEFYSDKVEKNNDVFKHILYSYALFPLPNYSGLAAGQGS